MQSIFDMSAWRELLGGAILELATKIGAFLPNLVGAVLILALGWLLARLVEAAASRALRTLGLDRAAARLRIGEGLERAGITRSASEVVAALLFWLLLLTFLLSSVETLGLQAVSATLDRLVAYIPSVIGAAFLAVLGLLFARFVGGLVGSAAAAADFPSSQRLAFLAQILVAGLVGVAALEQLGVETAVLVGPLTALLAAAGFAAGLAFALGARPIITHILAGHFLRRSLPRDTFVEVSGQRGVVERVGPTETLLRNGEHSFSVPNGQLLELVVVR